MGGSSSPQLVRALAEADVAQALRLANQMSISGVSRVLYAEIAAEHPETCDRFIEQWLAQLPPHERLAAATATMDLYLLDLVWLPHAEDRSVQRILDAAAASFGELQDTLGAFVSVAESPDASFNPEGAERLRDIGGTELSSLAELFAASSGSITSSGGEGFPAR